MSTTPNKIILLLSFPLSCLIIIVSCFGLFSPDFYSKETLNWEAQSVGQDMIDLVLLVPCLLITSILAYRNNRTATMMWGGVMFYLTYTFVLYCFDVHFNKLFVLYCFCLGLSFYSSAYFLFTQYKKIINGDLVNKFMVRFIGFYFLIIATLFYFLWLSEIIPAIIHKAIPKSLTEVGLFTNGVHVIDLAIFLPGIFITGIFLLKRLSLGFILTPVILTFFVLMDITIGTLALVMKMNGIEINITLTAIMGILALVSLGLLIWYFKETKMLDII